MRARKERKREREETFSCAPSQPPLLPSPLSAFPSSFGGRCDAPVPSSFCATNRRRKSTIGGHGHRVQVILSHGLRVPSLPPLSLYRVSKED